MRQPAHSRIWWRILAPWLSRPRRYRPRERFLLPMEWDRLKPILHAELLKIMVYFWILLLEGPRMSEARLMEWVHVDLVRGLWYKPTTKNGRAQLLPLSPQSCHLLHQLPQIGRYVFPGCHPDVPWSRTAVSYHWRKIRRSAGLQDVQIRDLRRTMASWMTIHGENLIVIKDILHHTDITTTQIYARSDHSAMRAALTRHGERVIAS